MSQRQEEPCSEPQCGRKKPPEGGCSHVDCPHRKPITAGIPDGLEEGRVPARINDNH